MRNLKKILALVLALMMVLSVMVTASAASPLEKYADKDSINPAYEQAVEVMTAAGVFSGNGTDFEPGRVLTRAEAATLITILNQGSTAGIVKCETNFDDVAATHWASGFITYCYDAGLIYGTSATTYEPGLELSYEQYAAMLLRVLGVDCTTDGKWYVPVRNNAVKYGLMAGIEGYTWTEGLTREAACQMTFNAMGHGATTTATGKYVIKVGTIGDDLKATFVAYTQGLTFNSIPEAVTYVDALNLYAFKLGSHYNVVAETASTSALMAKFNLEKTTGVDKYGAPSAIYSLNTKDADEKNDVVLYYPAAESAIITEKLTATEVATQLKGYWVVDNKYTVEGTAKEWWVGTGCDIVYVDGAANKTEIGEHNKAQTLASAISALTDDNAVVRIYATKGQITNIVVTNTQVAVAGDITKASEDGKEPETIKIDSYDVVNTDLGLKKGDVVTYTVCGSTVENVTALDYTVATLTSYNSKGEYTIGGKTYTLALDANAETIKAQFNKEYAYYFGANNTIIYASAVPGTEPEKPAAPVVDGYVMIVDAYYNDTIENKPTTDIWTGVTTNNYVGEVTVLVQAVDSEGNLNAYALEVKQADDKHKTLTKGDYYVTIAGVDTKVCAVDGTDVYTSDTLAAALANTIYTYNSADGVINLLAKASLLNYTGKDADYAGYAGTATEINKNTLAFVNGYNANQAIVLMTDETVFIVKEYNEKNEFVGYKAVTGAAALQSTTIKAGSLMIVDVATDGKDAKNNVYTVSVVFGIDDTFKATGSSVAPTETLVYIDSEDYVVSGLDKDNKPVYTYNAISSEGTLVAVNSSVNTVETGIYVLNNDGSLGTNKTSSFTAAKIDGVAAGKYIIGKTILVTGEDTAVIGGELAAGAEILYVVDKDNSALLDLVFVTKAADAQ